MDTTFTQSRADHRTAATAALAAITFAAGIALGAVGATIVEPVASPASISVAPLNPDAAWFRLYRAGERGVDGIGYEVGDHVSHLGVGGP